MKDIKMYGEALTLCGYGVLMTHIGLSVWPSGNTEGC